MARRPGEGARLVVRGSGQVICSLGDSVQVQSLSADSCMLLVKPTLGQARAPSEAAHSPKQGTSDRRVGRGTNDPARAASGRRHEAGRQEGESFEGKKPCPLLRLPVLVASLLLCASACGLIR